VYKAILKDTGETIAIKIQRPQILEQIALDMYLVREFASIVKRIFNLNTDTVGTVDAWGIGFINELNYIAEATNGMLFNEQIQKTSLSNVVFSPTIIEQYTTNSILTSLWVDGERLDKSNNNDVTTLCSIAMNTYLTMLLEFGTLHCDPHPGNLLRTTDGKLCILDWGMVTTIDSDLQLTLIEHMAHLTSADYNELPRDLLLLGFIEPNKANLIESSGIVDVLADIYGAWTAGGGAASIDVNKVINQLQDLTATNGNIFQIPPYFAYIAKSFSVLEGIGLSNQPGTYSIINECLPYISKRLLSDKETMGPALATFIFGPDKYNKDRIINYKRVRQLVEGFTQYTSSTSTSSTTIAPPAIDFATSSTIPSTSSSSSSTTTTEGIAAGSGITASTTTSISRVQQLEEITDQVLDLVFSVDETPIQQIVLEQVAKIVSANSRYALTEIRERSGILPTGRTVLGTIIDPLGLFRTSPLFRTNELDERTVEMTQQLVQLLDDIRQRQIDQEIRKRQAQIDAGIAVEPISESGSSVPSSTFGFNLSRDESIEFAQLLVRKVWDRREGIVFTSNRFIRTLLSLTADQLERGERDTRRVPSLSPLLTVSSSTMLVPALDTQESQQQQQQQQQLVMTQQQELPQVVVGSTVMDPVSSSTPFTYSSIFTPPTSSRLQTARQLLDSFRMDDDDNFPIMSTATATATIDNVNNNNNNNNDMIDLHDDVSSKEFERFRQTLLE
jgi:ABC1 atypical kinase-like domain